MPIAFPRTDAMIDMMQPANRDHHLAIGTKAWYLALPGTIGGRRLMDVWNPGPNGLHGTLTNMDPATDWNAASRRGGFGELDFGAVDNDQYVDIGGFVPVAPFTVSCWVLVTDLATQGHTMFCSGNSASTFHRQMLILDFTNDNKFNCVSMQDAGAFGAPNGALSLAAAETNRWYHIVGVWAATNKRSLYVDGVFQATVTADNTPASLDRTWLGRLADSTPNWESRGRQDDTRIHDLAWTADQIAEYYELSQKFYPDLLNRVPRRVYSVPAVGFIPYPNPRYAMTGGMQPMTGGLI